MSQNSSIEWTHHTFNPWRGCTKVSEGCKFCYADRQSKRNPGTLGVWGPNGNRVVASEAAWAEPVKWERWARDGICWACGGRGEFRTKVDGESRLVGCADCQGTGKSGEAYRARVFCASMADVFEDWDGPMFASDGDTKRACTRCHWQGLLPVMLSSFSKAKSVNDCPACGGSTRLQTMDDVRVRLFEMIRATPNLDWLLLTKRPENVVAKLRAALKTVHEAANHNTRIDSDRMRDLRWLDAWVDGKPPANVWLGTSIENQKTADERIPHLLRCPAAVRFLSMEPLLGAIDLCNGGHGWLWINELADGYRTGLHWVIAGGESGPNARPMHPDWARSIRDQCVAAGVPFFFKQWGEWWPFDQDAYRPKPAWQGNHQTYIVSGEQSVSIYRVGKHAAGRLLDGREWNEFPATPVAAAAGGAA